MFEAFGGLQSPKAADVGTQIPIARVPPDDLRFARFERIVVDWSAKTNALGCDSKRCIQKCKDQGTTLFRTS
jgi:hypothetical protein